MLQRLGTVMATAGLIPAFSANGDKNTAQRHFGELRINAAILVQQTGGTFALGLLAAPAHGLKLTAAAFTGVFPHSPAAAVSLTKPCWASKNMIKATRVAVL